jgi:uncharacterized membrane protein
MNFPIVGIIIGAIIVVAAIGFLTADVDVVRTKSGGPVDVIVLGAPSQKLLEVLSSSESMSAGINYQANIDPSYATADLLRNYDIVILQGDPYFDMNTREAVKQYVDSGGGLIVVGDAGSKHSEYSNVAGWMWPSGDGMPVPATLIGEWAGYSDVAHGSSLRLMTASHEIVGGIKIAGASLETPSTVYKVISKGRTIVSIDTDEGSVPAIIVGGAGLGTVVYFAYDPGETPTLFLNSIRYLS